MKKHIEYLIDEENKSHVSLIWGRYNKNTIWISTLGYRHGDHSEIEDALIKLGCRYSFGEYKALQTFDSTNGRTLTALVEPADRKRLPDIKRERHPTNIQIDGIDHKDYPDYVDAYISSAEWSDTGEVLTDAELDELSEDSDWMYELVQEYLY